eukprot:256116-Pyramimonas_sp.AAC.1
MRRSPPRAVATSAWPVSEAKPGRNRHPRCSRWGRPCDYLRGGGFLGGVVACVAVAGGVRAGRRSSARTRAGLVTAGL